MLLMVYLAQALFPPVDAAHNGWWMTDRGSLGWAGYQTAPGEDLRQVAVAFRDTFGEGGGIVEVLVADVNGDGQNEMVVMKHQEIHAVKATTNTLLWRFMPPDSAYFGDACRDNTPSLGDMDGDGILEVVAGDETGRVWILDGRDGRVDHMIQLPVFDPTPEACPRGPLYAVDLEGDGIPGVVVTGQDSLDPGGLTRLYYFRILCSGGTCEDSLVFKRALLPKPLYVPMGDLDGDGTLEMLVWVWTRQMKRLFALTATGDTLWSQAPFDSILAPGAVVDWDRDSVLDVVAFGYGLFIAPTYILDGPTGALKDSFTLCGSSAYADVNRDGRLEMACWIGFKTVRLVDDTGGLIWEQTLPESEFIVSEPVLGDFAPDSGLEIFLCTTNNQYLLNAWGDILWGLPYSGAGSCRASIGDVDMDGKSEIIMSSSAGVWVLDRPTDVEERGPARSTGDHGFRLIPGGFALRHTHPVTVFDLAGRRVFSGKTRMLFLPPGGYLVTLPETTVKIVVGR